MTSNADSDSSAPEYSQGENRMANSTSWQQDQRIHETITDKLGDMTWLFELIEDIAEPDDIFSEETLERWALEHRFVKEG